MCTDFFSRDRKYDLNHKWIINWVARLGPWLVHLPFLAVTRLELNGRTLETRDDADQRDRGWEEDKNMF